MVRLATVLTIFVLLKKRPAPVTADETLASAGHVLKHKPADADDAGASAAMPSTPTD